MSHPGPKCEEVNKLMGFQSFHLMIGSPATMQKQIIPIHFYSSKRTKKETWIATLTRSRVLHLQHTFRQNLMNSKCLFLNRLFKIKRRTVNGWKCSTFFTSLYNDFIVNIWTMWLGTIPSLYKYINNINK